MSTTDMPAKSSYPSPPPARKLLTATEYARPASSGAPPTFASSTVGTPPQYDHVKLRPETCTNLPCETLAASSTSFEMLFSSARRSTAPETRSIFTSWLRNGSASKISAYVTAPLGIVSRIAPLLASATSAPAAWRIASATRLPAAHSTSRQPHIARRSGAPSTSSSAMKLGLSHVASRPGGGAASHA